MVVQILSQQKRPRRILEATVPFPELLLLANTGDEINPFLWQSEKPVLHEES